MEHKKIEYVHIIKAATHRAWKGLGVKPVALIVGGKKSRTMKANTTRKLEARQRKKLSSWKNKMKSGNSSAKLVITYALLFFQVVSLLLYETVKLKG